MLRQLAQMTGSIEVAEPILEDAEEALADARADMQGRARLRVFCPIWRRPWMTVGPNTYMHDFIAACGGLNIFAERHERYPLSDLDEVARRVPEVVLLPDEPYPFTTKHISELARVSIRPRRTRPAYIPTGRQRPCVGTARASRTASATSRACSGVRTPPKRMEPPRRPRPAL